MAATVYLIPSLLHEEGLPAIPFYITDTVRQCGVFFVENERTARRYLKRISKEIVIDNHEWVTMENNQATAYEFRKKIKEHKTIGIISEAGCPGIADPGQQLVAIAHEMNVKVKPLVGPNSILLALMASGMNGQQYCFVGYLPVKDPDRNKAIKNLEAESIKKNSTQIFIETPYRNNQVIEALCKNCNPSTRLCIAVDLTGQNEWIKSKTIAEWKSAKPDVHKRLAIFCLQA